MPGAAVETGTAAGMGRALGGIRIVGVAAAGGLAIDAAPGGKVTTGGAATAVDAAPGGKVTTGGAATAVGGLAIGAAPGGKVTTGGAAAGVTPGGNCTDMVRGASQQNLLQSSFAEEQGEQPDLPMVRR
jgi:hypothetical protein